MTPQERKAALRARKIKNIEIARRTGFQPPIVSETLHGTRTNRRIQIAIARAIRRPVDEVFPRQRRRERALV